MMKIGKVPSTLLNIDEEPRLLGTKPIAGTIDTKVKET